jgi:type II secretory pathway pseudopilin PulG
MLMGQKIRRRCGFTVVELCGVVAIIGVLVALLLPAVQAARENARRTSCQNNLLNVALAIRHYQSVHGHYPVQLHGTDGSEVPGADNDGRLSFLVGLLPYISQMALVDYLDQEQQSESVFSPDWQRLPQDFDNSTEDGTEDDSEGVRRWPRNGPEPFTPGYAAWQSEVPTYRCPSDPGYGANSGFRGGAVNGRTNYAACLGDGCLTAATGPYEQIKGTLVFDEQLAKQTNAAMRGAFVPRVPTRDSDVTDGLSYTLLLGEIGTSLGDCGISTKPAVAGQAEQLLNDPGLARTVNQERQAADAESFFRTSRWDPVDDPRLNVQSGLNGSQERGLNWVDGMPLYTGFNTILPPNRELVLSEARDDCWGVLPPSSYHQGGVSVAMVDGAVRFISDEIDSGNDHQPTVYLNSSTPPGSRSPFGVWGAMGTRANSELASFQKVP